MNPGDLLPYGWRRVPLEEILVLADSGVWGEADSQGVSVLRSTNFRDDGTLDLAKLSLRNIPADRLHLKKLSVGDILLERSGGGPNRPVGRVCLFQGDARVHAFGNFCQRLHPDEDTCLPEFLFRQLYWFHLSGGTELMQNRTTGIRNLQYKRYLTKEILLPPVPEQRRIIAGVEQQLATAERVRQAALAQLAALDAAPTALLRSVFAAGPQSRLWRSVALGEVARYINGRAFKPSDWGESGERIIRIQNLTNAQAEFNLYSGDVLPKHRVDDGDLLVAWSASLGVHSWNRGRAILNQHIFKVEETADLIDRSYLHRALETVMTSLKREAHGATMQHVTKPRFEATTIPLPPLAEQRSIVASLDRYLAAVERARKAAQARLDAAEALSGAILRGAFAPLVP